MKSISPAQEIQWGTTDVCRVFPLTHGGSKQTAQHGSQNEKSQMPSHNDVFCLRNHNGSWFLFIPALLCEPLLPPSFLHPLSSSYSSSSSSAALHCVLRRGFLGAGTFRSLSVELNEAGVDDEVTGLQAITLWFSQQTSEAQFSLPADIS